MASNIDVIYGTLQPLEQEFQAVCSEPTIAFKREMEFAMQAFSGNEYLAKVAAGNPLSTRSAVMNVSAIGITLNPAQKLAYLVPRKGKICLDISYMGLMHIAQQSGAIKWCQSAIVRKNDKFKRVGIDRAPEHEFNEFATAEERGEMVGVYCVVKTDDGDYLTNTMRIADVYAIRDRSEAYKSGKPSPWSTDEEQMILKTVVKQAAKYWPRRERLDKAIDYVNTEGGEGINFAAERGVEKDVSPATDETLKAINDAMLPRDGTWDTFLPYLSKRFKRPITEANQLTEAEAKTALSLLTTQTTKAAA
ncbi:recombinase RecT [Yersinia enterocolitica]|uniref:recombinase RecT n=1 Tax=Yersinia enterocolitica TaxID=630 RepID=UPI0028B6F370|nr:recombinase RecT [Yersinia enterocolitica]EKN3982768.1 recombinase RecT [Yersinia enterocolitica]EKN3986978.1 recombinase RecT [Yersinia enterocolitica]EKN5943908.1 recombinase RecT [Yersinia enterocolitica]EKN6318683.1 recombinase RecT [Yersinia enterocolitica]